MSPLQAPEFRLQAPEFWLQAPEFRVRAPEFWLWAPEFWLWAPEFRLREPDSFFTADHAARRIKVGAGKALTGPFEVGREETFARLEPITISSPTVGTGPLSATVVRPPGGPARGCRSFGCGACSPARRAPAIKPGVPSWSEDTG
ncbi:hypothetical protein Atai01_22780 [Amycolatopsis taiwanensis]|uniref:Uncharacterized protein n=1 Tax=Amycolatopsis taiwanensis TaxID=342230 RepID=A0A9W6QX49_9PSEU|nr:hypothetical protein Atai01_22780 [Amycolatopsis taiwanensis]